MPNSRRIPHASHILQPLVDAWTQSTEAIQELVAPLAEPDWNRATECPGWSVRDVVSHLIGTELGLLGDPRPIHTLPRDLRHVVDEPTRYNEVPVDVRRCHTAPEMTSELELALIRRRRSLRDLTDPDQEVLGLMGRQMRLGSLLRLRAFDVWAHEQDIRRAIGVPGNLDTPAAYVARDSMVAALPEVVTRAGAAPHTAVSVDVHGPIEFMRTVEVDPVDPARAAVGEHAPFSPRVTLTTDWETYARLACGRIRPERADVKIEGDTALATKILAEFSITP
nr:maleylpyruvate isomerase family mycothiol-dependent enzyme [Mangrovactinospora gilvigrisea]